MSAKINETRRVAISLLDDLEGAVAPVEGILMKAKRLARLMRDADAQKWLDLETRGYPEKFNFRTLGTCRQYATAGGRLNSDDSYWSASLPEIEANCRSNEARVNSFQKPGSTPQVIENFLVKNATEAFVVSQLNMQQKLADQYRQTKSLLVSLRSGIHSYATDMFLAIELGDVAQDIFESARGDVDSFVRAHCPKGAEQLIAINERMADKSAESRTAALTTCRRLLMTVADSIFPARDMEWIDGRGKARKVGVEQYKNRLLAYMAERQGASSQEIIASGIEHLAARLDAIYEKTCKGVHVDVSEQEARLAVIHTYLFIGEVANSSKAER
ncbi:hypothetical protein [Bradyrhizobium erythrophlei]|nr:hypothetical protein [Bradyrhizobium erythrophlei]